MTIVIHWQNEQAFSSLPEQTLVRTWLNVALEHLPSSPGRRPPSPASHSVTLRFIDAAESAFLNETYRHKQGPTNVLSFPEETIPGFVAAESDSFGDLAICVPLVLKEAAEQHKTVDSHFAHLIIHGFLHLLGYDHEKKAAAYIMENLEITILRELGYANPYQ